jgi:hypothetical protein
MSSSTIIPYIVETAHPDCKRPYVSVDTCQTTADNLETDLNDAYFKALVTELCYELDGPITQKSLNEFFRDYYSETIMCNAPLVIRYFMDGKWHNFKQPPIEILAKKYEDFWSW